MIHASVFILASASCLLASGRGLTDEPIQLREPFAPGYHYHVSSRVDLSGTLVLPEAKSGSRTLNLSGKSAIEYDERVLAQGVNGEVARTIRSYKRMEFERRIGDQLQQSQLRPEVRRLVILRQKHVEVPFAPAGPLTVAEIDLVRTDVFTPALRGLLPEKAVQAGDRWKATSHAVQELTDLERIEEGELNCRLDSIVTLSGRRQARVAFAGTIRGLGEDGPAQHRLDGYLFFDLESNHVSYLSLKGTQSPLDKNGKALGRIEGTFVLTRTPASAAADLNDDALKGVNLEPNEDNTLLLHEDAELGVRFLHSRRWRIAAGSNGRQIGLDGPNGNGLLMTIEPLARVPTGAQYLRESRDFLTGQKAVISRTDPPQSIRPEPSALEYFGIDAAVGGQQVHLDYYCVRQELGGATLAARLLPAGLEQWQRDVRRVALSIQIIRRQ